MLLSPWKPSAGLGRRAEAPPTGAPALPCQPKATRPWHCQRRWRAPQSQPIRGGCVAVSAAAQVAPAETSKAWPTCSSQLVSVRQVEREAGYHLRVELEGADLPAGARVELHWGVYRSDSSKWQHPEATIPPGSHLDPESGGMRSPMQPEAGGGRYSASLTLPRELAPVTLAFVMHVLPPGGEDGPGRYITPLSGAHFSELVGMQPGAAEPLGVSWAPGTPGAVNFAMRSRGAERVALVILKPPTAGGSSNGGWGVMEVELDPRANRTGDTWHVMLSALPSLEGLCYGWRVEGDTAWETGNRFQPDAMMLDPHAPLLAYLPLDPAPPLPLPTIQLNDGSKAAVAGSLACLTAARDPQRAAAVVGEEAGGPGPARPGARPLEALRLLELDVRSFAKGKKVQHVGQYLGVAERVDHLKAVGANAVLLAPAYATAPGIGALGRAGVSFMAPDPQLCSNPADPRVAAWEFRGMVEQLHRQGIEVIMQVDLTFTAEGTDSAPNKLSFRGLDNAIYYRPNGVLNCGHAVVRQFVLSALRHWALEYGVDGFCFLNAENLAQDRDGLVMDAPPLGDSLAFDPLLSSVKFIAAPSDEALLPRAGARGFPHWGLWLQRNNAFTRDLLAFLLEGTSGMASSVATRLAGSPDIFAAQWDSGMPGDLAAGRRPAFGLNSLSSLGHMSLQALAEEAAAMLTRTAAVAGLGSPGLAAASAAAAMPTHTPTMAAAEAVPAATVLAKSLLLAMVMAQGVPIITQDVTADVEMARFVGVLMRLRRRLLPLLSPPLFDSPRDIRWHGAALGSEPDWDGSLGAVGTPAASYLAFSVRAPDGSAVYLGINPHPSTVRAGLPAPPFGTAWMRVVDTSLEAPEDAVLDGGAPVPGSAAGSSYAVGPKAAVLLVAAPSSVPPAGPYGARPLA